MKIAVLVQAEHWLDRAGVRIRYRRIEPELKRLGCALTVKAISTWMSEDPADVVILSKCTDARALMVVNDLRSRGILVGVDLFDDYFSAPIGPCHIHRENLREMALHVDFFLCSTERMREVSAVFAPGKPSHILNDPFDDFDPAVLAQRLDEKATQARESGRFELLWFGNGNNPIFAVGLTDLFAFSPALRPFADGPYDVGLRVLTNADALDVANLARLRSLPLPVIVEEWSEQAEQHALDAALASFLPVNYQNFSVAKSLNRGVSALTNGTQILSSGYELYRELGPLVYRDAESLARDLTAGKLLLRSATLDILAGRMRALADPVKEAEALLAFVKRMQANKCSRPTASEGRSARHAVLHGNRSPASVLALCRSTGWMSIASPFVGGSALHDVHIGFFEGLSLPQILLSREAIKYVSAKGQIRLRSRRNRPGHHFAFSIELPDNRAGRILRALRPAMIATRAGRIVHYARVMAATEAVCAEIFDDLLFIRSERENSLIGLRASLAETPEMLAGP